jgi:DNA-binding CsgD family transcriptional regulator
MIDMFAPQVACALLAAGRIHDARQHLAEWSAAVESFGSPPLPEASCRLWTALVRRAVGDDWLDAAHGVLELADPHGFRLLRVDALELVAEALVARGDPVSAARVLGAAISERTRTGYVGRWRPDPEASAQAHAAVAEAQPSAFEEGRSMDTADVVEWLRRTRGERGRPSHGWDGLTPTERRVVELVGEGLPNAEIAGRLLMGVTTVKTHLTHVFAKLGVTNRTELAAEVTRRRTDP